jgi:tripartite-type tricarboxylate transporter receptor subunit TctC
MTDMKEFELFSRAFWINNVMLDTLHEVMTDVIIPRTDDPTIKALFEKLAKDSKAVLKIGDAVRTADWSKIEQAVDAASIQMSHHESKGGHA